MTYFDAMGFQREKAEKGGGRESGEFSEGGPRVRKNPRGVKGKRRRKNACGATVEAMQHLT